MKAVRWFRDRDYVETVEGLFFTVVSNLHPQDRVIAYLKYAPSSSGLWGNKVKYSRMMPYYDIPSLLNTIQLLEQQYPHYVYDCPFMGIKISAVPLNYIKQHFKPEERLANLREESRDELESLALELAEYIAGQAGISLSNFGVTGSILVDIHRPEFSDVDLVVYGRNNALKVKETLRELYREGDVLKRVEGAKLEALLERRVKIFHLTREEAFELTMRKWNRGMFRGRDFSVHPVKVEEEVKGRFEDRVFKGLGVVELKATVADNQEALFMPAVYTVKDVEVTNGPREAKDIVEVVSYEGLYIDIAEPRERIMVRGKLERVEDRAGGSYFRVLVGSPEAKGYDYIKPLFKK